MKHAAIGFRGSQRGVGGVGGRRWGDKAADIGQEQQHKPRSSRVDKMLADGSTWQSDVAQDFRHFNAAAATDGPASHRLDPRSIAEALRSPDAAEWQAAIDAEVASCIAYGVWEVCHLPPGRKALPCRMLLERKRDGRHKARLVARGHCQQLGLDFQDTFAPVCSYHTFRMMLAVAAHEALELRQLDIRTAFLNGPLEKEVYLRPPAGLEGLAGVDGKVLRLQRAMYGLRQASRAWNKRLEAELTRKDLVQSDADPALWILHGKDGAVLAMFYVDDGLVPAKTAEKADTLVELVASRFAIRALGEPEDFLGIQISRDRAAHTITIVEEHKALELAAGLGLVGGRKAVPMSPETCSGLRGAQEGKSMADKLEYQCKVGSLLHLAQCTRPDIALAVGALSAFWCCAKREAPQNIAECGTICGKHSKKGDHFWEQREGLGGLVRRTLRNVPKHKAQHNRLDCDHV
jgi:hypothetical protein